MKNKGFSLIELLAVIVILAIIALIATPVILNVIDDSKKETYQRSLEMYAKAVENAIVQYQLKENKMPTTYNDIKDYIDYDGEKITCEKMVIYEDGSIYLEGIKIGQKTLASSYGKKQGCENGEEVYFDVLKGKKCSKSEYEKSYDETKKDYLNSLTGYNGIKDENDTSNKNSCLKFYVFNYEDGEVVNLILDHNTTAVIPRAGAKGQPTNLLNALKTATDSWQGTEIPTDYNFYQGDKLIYTIDYDTEEYKYKARLITAQEIAQITQHPTYDETTTPSTDTFYFDSNTSEISENCKSGNLSGCKYGWLYDRTSNGCESAGCLHNSDVKFSSYWTATLTSNNLYNAWLVNSTGNLSMSNVNVAGRYGVRPVIEVLKSKLN